MEIYLLQFIFLPQCFERSAVAYAPTAYACMEYVMLSFSRIGECRFVFHLFETNTSYRNSWNTYIILSRCALSGRETITWYESKEIKKLEN